MGLNEVRKYGVNGPGTLFALLGLAVILINVGLILKAYRDAGGWM